MKRFAPTLLAMCLGAAGPAMADDATSFQVEPKARLHLDYGAYDADVEPMDDGLIVRRATLGLEGQFNADWSFEVGYGFADDGEIRPRDGEFRDVTLEYEGWSAGDITVGQFKLPFGLEEATSSNDLSLIERSLPVDTFAPSRRMGVGFSHERKAWTIRAMVFGSSISGRDRGRGAAARFTLAPVHNASTVVHFGVAAVTEKPHGEVDFDTTPEARVADVDLVNTGDIAHVDRINRLGLESAWRAGPYSVQAEWMQAAVERGNGWSDADLDGWYVAGSWVLTGESRPYEDGEFKGVEPDGPGGAWELTLRYSRIDLTDGDVRGGREHNVTVGLNYYLNEHVRMMLNVIDVHSRRHGVTDDPGIVLLRAQFNL
ncbi:MAG TPA: OprO/OprP family phosphate-selective porin [Oleiagrimonas sp.]|nr:OprO/OprP family phosphate-selective porin [Oleiagrimonas sp.]